MALLFFETSLLSTAKRRLSLLYLMCTFFLFLSKMYIYIEFMFILQKTTSFYMQTLLGRPISPFIVLGEQKTHGERGYSFLNRIVLKIQDSRRKPCLQ